MEDIKIDLAKLYAFKLLSVIKEYGADEHEHFIRLLREFREEITKELTEGSKRPTTSDEHISNNGNVTRPEKVDTKNEAGHLFRLPEQDSNETVFNDPQKIEPL